MVRTKSPKLIRSLIDKRDQDFVNHAQGALSSELANAPANQDGTVARKFQSPPVLSGPSSRLSKVDRYSLTSPAIPPVEKCGILLIPSQIAFQNKASVTLDNDGC